MHQFVTHTHTHTRIKRRQPEKENISQHTAASTLLVAPVHVCVHNFHVRHKAILYVCHGECVRAHARAVPSCVYVASVFWCGSVRQKNNPLTFNRENPQIPKWIDNCKQGASVHVCACVRACVCEEGLLLFLLQVFYEFWRENNYEFLPQLQDREAGRQAGVDRCR